MKNCQHSVPDKRGEVKREEEDFVLRITSTVCPIRRKFGELENYQRRASGN